jgi:hypothetical protein
MVGAPQIADVSGKQERPHDGAKNGKDREGDGLFHHAASV